MREIKFRAWDKDGCRMMPMGNLLRTDIRWFKSLFYGGREDTVLMQYTGLKDKNGMEIYEGDIVRYKQKPPRKRVAIDYYSQVIYKDSMFCINPNWIRWHAEAFSFMCRHTEVIGNIYENPELLK